MPIASAKATPRIMFVWDRGARFRVAPQGVHRAAYEQADADARTEGAKAHREACADGLCAVVLKREQEEKVECSHGSWILLCVLPASAGGQCAKGRGYCPGVPCDSMSWPASSSWSSCSPSWGSTAITAKTSVRRAKTAAWMKPTKSSRP